MNEIPSQAPASRYRIADIAFFPAGDRLVLAYAKESQATRFLRAEIVSLLVHCHEFRTLDDHLQTFAYGKEMSSDALRALRRELQQLVQSGYLVSQSLTEQIFRSSDEQPLSVPIASIGFLTCDRVEMLQRSMSSAIEHCKHFGRTNDFVVVDDSSQLETREAYRNMLRSLQARYGVKITYAGLEEKEAFARKLARAGSLPAEIVSFACMPDRHTGLTTVGANRNALLLHSVGDLIFSSDDDILYQIAASPSVSEGLALRSQGNPLDVWFFPDRINALEAVHFVEQDLLALHEQWLGKDPRMCEPIVGQSGPFSLEQAEPSLIRRLAIGKGKIALTANGTLGDCSWDNPYFYLFQQGETLSRLTRSESAYQSARTSREMVQAVSQITLTKRADPLFAMSIGLDNRELLPPFTPLGRGEDIGFGTMLSTCFDTSYTVHLPWVVLHSPSEARSFQQQPLFSIGFNTWVSSCMSLFDPGFAETPTARLRKLGQHLDEIGRLPKASFEEFTRQHMWRSMSALITGLEKQLQMGQEALPAFWIKEVRNFIIQARQSALTPLDQLYVPRGAPESIQRFLVQLGELLACWSDLVEAARQLRRQGERLAQPV